MVFGDPEGKVHGLLARNRSEKLARERLKLRLFLHDF